MIPQKRFNQQNPDWKTIGQNDLILQQTIPGKKGWIKRKLDIIPAR